MARQHRWFPRVQLTGDAKNATTREDPEDRLAVNWDTTQTSCEIEGGRNAGEAAAALPRHKRTCARSHQCKAQGAQEVRASSCT